MILRAHIGLVTGILCYQSSPNRLLCRAGTCLPELEIARFDEDNAILPASQKAVPFQLFFDSEWAGRSYLSSGCTGSSK